MTSNEKFDIYLSDFRTYCKIHAALDKNFRLKDSDIFYSINQTYERNKELPDFLLNDDEKEKLVKKIKTSNTVFQEEGSVILGDYEHDRQWYSNLQNDSSFENYYWNRYKEYLLNSTSTPTGVIETLENTTIKDLMSYIGNPNEESSFSYSGLVVGDVQSGKTLNFIGLLTSAADAGYKVIFVLAGTVESLRRQTQIRVEEGFIGYDSVEGEDVGVSRGLKTPISLTSRNKDFTGLDYQNTAYRLNNAKEPFVFVIKKNVSVLRKVYNSLKKINTFGTEKINSSLLMIDDEADNASVNTRKSDDNDPTRINEQIRKILKLFERTTYVGFTATPFANVFIDYDSNSDMLGDDLFPRHFIYALKAPSNYCGADDYFDENNNFIRYIDDASEEVFPIKHKKEWKGNKLFPSLYYSINCFLLANAIRDIRDIDKKTHRSMLINMSTFTDVQFVIKDIVSEYYESIKKAVKITHKLSIKEAIKNKYVFDLMLTFNNEYGDCKDLDKRITWEDVFEKLYNSIANIAIVVVNSKKNSEKLDYYAYKKDGLRVIAIGGLALSRGLTLENLMISYFYRNTSTYDVLMQMGRWFGYRDGYSDLCRIFVTRETADFYRYIHEAITCLKEDIDRMGKQGKTPGEYGIRIRTISPDLKITAPNKMRHTETRTIRKSYYGGIFETPYLDSNLDINANNLRATFDFLNKINITSKDLNVKHPYFRDIDKKLVIELLNSLSIHSANENFDTKQIIPFIKKGDKELEKFDILIMGGESEIKFVFPHLAIDMCVVKRKYDINDYGDGKIIRVSGQRAHLIGRQDTRNGLTKDELEKINGNHLAQDYLINGRNPLIIIYFIDLKNEFKKEDAEEFFTGITNSAEYIKFYIENNTKYFVGFAIGFPQKDNVDSTIEEYTVNKTANFYDNDHGELEDDEYE